MNIPFFLRQVIVPPSYNCSELSFFCSIFLSIKISLHLSYHSSVRQSPDSINLTTKRPHSQELCISVAGLLVILMIKS